MLGKDLTAFLSPRHEIVPAHLPELDITRPGALAPTLASTRPDVVIHAAAFTAVDECERQPEVAFRVNGEGTRYVAQACREAGLPMLYVSTDYVFDGEKPAPYVESDAPNPLGIYGRSKLEGERLVRELLERYWIVRTSWLFGPHGRNFVLTILERARAGTPLPVVNDQIGAPTYTVHLAAVLEAIITRGEYGIYHATSQGSCSWYEFARTIVHEAGMDESLVTPIPTSASDRLAPRPRNSRLAATHLQQQGLPLLPAWQEGLRGYLLRVGAIQN
jgi:dTDP-4-dehydrorhamnose reductase